MMTATLVEDREDDRLYRLGRGFDGYRVLPASERFLLVSKYGSKMYGNRMTCIWPADENGETTGSPLATYYGAVTHDEALKMFGIEVVR